MTMNTTEQYIYIAACACTGKPAELESADFQELWDISKRHNTTALTAKGLLSSSALEQSGAAEQKRWKNALNNSVKKTMLFDAERNRLISFFEKNGIWYLPLKGAVINSLYNSYGTREFADNDILIDPDRTDDAKRYMLEHGYTFRTDEFSSDEYSKDPFYNFELHRALIEDGGGFETFADYYRNVKERLIKDEGNGFGYHFTDDDFYIFFIFHAFKHYDNRGTGFRTIVDEFVILRAKKQSLDFDYIEKELDRLGITAFEKSLRALAEKLFTEPEKTERNLAGLSDDEREMLLFILSCNTFGQMSNLFKKQLAEISGGEKPNKVKYYFRRVFPERSRFKYSNPFVYKHRAVYPFFLLYRLAVKPIKHRKFIKQEISSIKNIK